MKKTMKELPLSEQPYEKAERDGVESLSDRELLTALIRTGTKTERADEIALHLLELCNPNGLQGLWDMSLEELKQLPGIGNVKAIQLLCVCELAKRMARGHRIFGLQITNPEDVVNYYGVQLKYAQRECVVLLIMDSKNRVISEEILSVGTMHSSPADPREIFVSALKKNGASIILLHNHPSGDPAPSKEDIHITKRVAEAGLLLGICLYDHIIIGQNSYSSLRAEGYLA